MLRITGLKEMNAIYSNIQIHPNLREQLAFCKDVLDS